MFHYEIGDLQTNYFFLQDDETPEESKVELEKKITDNRDIIQEELVEGFLKQQKEITELKEILLETYRDNIDKLSDIKKQLLLQKEMNEMLLNKINIQNGLIESVIKSFRKSIDRITDNEIMNNCLSNSVL